MGIDGIGKPPAPGGPLGPDGTARPGAAAPTEKTFKVERAESPERVSGADPLARLERGEINVDQYFDARVSHAVTHLEGKLSSEQIDFVKSSLREQLSTDPVLLELVRRSTGSLPTAD
ncbi:MAG: hypothetical protein IPI67_13410 [Myxococcales bacterium]|nr:hypothetical protein [Myxococcales bacterium]